jgi:hypothetical protein
VTDTRNPWLDALDQDPLVHTCAESISRPGQVALSDHLPLDPLSGPPSPQDGVPHPQQMLPVRRETRVGTLWIVGPHGGSGETSLAALNEHWIASGHAWPERAAVSPAVIVARTHLRGLLAAQAAITQWAGRRAGSSVNLLGLILFADAPGRLPRPLQDLATVIRGGAPRTWDIPWIEAWRAEVPGDGNCPRVVHRLIANLRTLTTEGGTASRPPTADPTAVVSRGSLG